MNFCLIEQCNHDQCWKQRFEDELNAPEDRYEAFEIIIKTRTDDQSWFDIFVDLVTENCEGTGEQDEEGNFEGCTCGMESAGGMTGTLQQCFTWRENLGQGITPLIVARAVKLLVDGSKSEEDNELTDKVIRWARAEIEFEEKYPWSWESDE